MEPGSRIGPYEILSQVGAGGMGEVYRARDPRLGREVAIKVLPSSFVDDSEHLRRFEQEARATGVLNHPNLLTIFDFGTHENSPYMVCELLDGRTLRNQLEVGPLPFRTAIEYAKQIASGLSAAHEKGVVHRDLKPENLFITREGRIKILDFGLARLMIETPDSETTAQLQTRPGVVMGTPGYISPEQLRAVAADARSDIFSLGTMLYEMFSGARPFQGRSSAELMTAILREEPPPMDDSVPRPLQRIIRRCLEKNPENRFQSAKDVGFAIEAAVEPGGTVTPSGGYAAPTTLVPTFRKLTFRRGFIQSARFAPDGSVLYGAAWEKEPLEIYSSHPGNPESRRVGIADADVLAISPAGEMAISLGRRFVLGWVTLGTLARVPFLGGAPREICEDVQEADWDPQGESMLIIRRVDERYRLEYPIGRPIFEAEGWISQPRFSPKGDLIAFLEHPFWGDDGANVAVIDLAGNRKLRSSHWTSTGGLAWTPDGREIIVAGDTGATGRNFIAIDLSGKERPLFNAPGRLSIHDIAANGTMLVTYDSMRRGIEGIDLDTEVRDLSWFDWSFPADLSDDGTKILFEEQLANGNGLHSIHVRRTNGSPAIRLGDGRARSISPDGKWVLGVEYSSNEELVMIPTGAGDPKKIRCPGIESFQWWSFFPDGERFLIWGKRSGEGYRLFVHDLERERPTPVSPEGVGLPFAVSPDGSSIAATGPTGALMIYDAESESAEKKIVGQRPGDLVIQWRPDGGAIEVYERLGPKARIWEIDLSRGSRELVREITPSDPAGVIDIGPVLMPRSAPGIAFGYRRLLKDLYIAEGML